MSMEESISLEETNKIRISLGLKPLTEDKEPVNDKEKEAEANYTKHQEKQAKERESKRIADRIAKARNKLELNSSLGGTTLGDPDGDSEDTLKWIKKAKKREKELARKRQQELESMDNEMQQSYTEADLAGLKVSHDLNEMEEGDARILTLKDSRILDNEEDELQNVELAEKESDKKRVETKIKTRSYTGFDDDEFLPGLEGQKRSVLSKYDEDLGIKRETDFRLGSSTLSEVRRSRAESQETTASVNKALLSIDYDKNVEMDDYLKDGDPGFKKPKTKKKRPSRRAPTNVDPTNVGVASMEIDEKTIIPRHRDLDANFVDDDELQAMLARSRRVKTRTSKKISPEEVAKKIASERAQVPADDALHMIKAEEDQETNEGGITFDDTSEFVRSITYDPTTSIKSEPRETKPNSKIESQRVEQEMQGGDIAMSELEAGEVPVKEEDDEDEEAMLNALEDAIKITEAEESAAGKGEVIEGTSGEQSFGRGLASTLNILRQQGLLAASTSDQTEREKTQLQRDLWLAEHRRRLAQRELERQLSRGGNKDQAQREYENRLREQQEARDNLEAFKNYKPDVNIVYYDEFGRTLTPKEAWKALSHKFHGKGSGKMKTEKRLKKIAEEKKKEAMTSGDTPLSMNRAFQIRQEKAGQAHFVLSIGNRGAVPQAAEFFDSQSLAKGKTEKTRSKKKAKNTEFIEQAPDTGFITLAAPQSVQSSASLSPPSAEAVVRPGFSRVSTTIEVEDGIPTPGPEERTKVAFGFSAGKRRATSDLAEERAPKKR